MEEFQILGKRYMRNKPVYRFTLIPGYDGHIDYRSPYDGERIVSQILHIGESLSIGDRVDKWHQDAMGAPHGLILWSNIYPTEVLLSDGRIVAGKPNDVVLINNRVAMHRLPAAYLNDPKAERHFARSVIGGVPTPTQIARWSRSLRNADAYSW